MQLKNSYFYFKSAISPEQCKKIIDLGKSQIEEDKKSGIATHGTTGGNREKQSLGDNAVPWLYDLVHPYIQRANISSGWNYQWDCSEKFQFTTYSPGGFYGWHTDSGMCHYSKYKRIIPGITPENEDGSYSSDYTKDTWKIGKIRKLSVTINLNSPGEYEGGNLKFDYGPHVEGERYHECTEIRPQGSIIVFPSFVAHQVTPITRGTRYSLVLWSLGEPFK